MIRKCYLIYYLLPIIRASRSVVIISNFRFLIACATENLVVPVLIIEHPVCAKIVGFKSFLGTSARIRVQL